MNVAGIASAFLTSIASLLNCSILKNVDVITVFSRRIRYLYNDLTRLYFFNRNINNTIRAVIEKKKNVDVSEMFLIHPQRTKDVFKMCIKVQNTFAWPPIVYWVSSLNCERGEGGWSCLLIKVVTIRNIKRTGIELFLYQYNRRPPFKETDT